MKYFLGHGEVQAQPGFQTQPALQQVQVLHRPFGLKTTSHVKPQLKNSFPGSDGEIQGTGQHFGPGLPCEVVFMVKS